MGRDLKSQVGARIPQELLARAKAAAVNASVSFNVWVEQAFNMKLRVDQHGRELLDAISEQNVIEGQTSIDIPVVVDETLEPGTAELRRNGETVATIMDIDKTLEPFAKNCIAQTLHWRHGPGNPCKSCRGEI